MPDTSSRPNRVQAFLTRRSTDQAPVFQITGQSGAYVRVGTEADMARFAVAEAAINSGGLRPPEPATYDSDTGVLTITGAGAPAPVRLHDMREGLGTEVTESINSRPANIRELFREAAKGYADFPEAQRAADPVPGPAVSAEPAPQRRGRLAAVAQRVIDAVDRAVDRVLGGPGSPPPGPRPAPQAPDATPRQPASRPVTAPSVQSPGSTAFSGRERQQAARSAALATLAAGGTVLPRQPQGAPGRHRKPVSRRGASRGPARPRKAGTAAAPPGR